MCAAQFIKKSLPWIIDKSVRQVKGLCVIKCQTTLNNSLCQKKDLAMQVAS